MLTTYHKLSFFFYRITIMNESSQSFIRYDSNRTASYRYIMRHVFFYQNSTCSDSYIITYNYVTIHAKISNIDITSYNSRFSMICTNRRKLTQITIISYDYRRIYNDPYPMTIYNPQPIWVLRRICKPYLRDNTFNIKHLKG